MVDERKIYILLTDTGTVFSKLIRLYTKAPLNHASIALDSELREVYSFGRKHPLNPFYGGFVKERVQGYLVRTEARPTQCALYSCTVSTDTYERIRLRLKQMEQNPEQYKYNLLGLFGIIFNIHIRRENAYFCSQFVASMLQEHGMYVVDKNWVWVTPEDFRHSPSLQLVYRGDLRTKVRYKRRKYS
ncbi:hypothetical protein NDS46_28535 [Paenibacillus thiaminolyticus]|uniref:hypothetical protein n=1 Tax=Paenibacillus thiaminolyticus TaxID=49283 RepID=UPI00233008A5|nr:hypothetical protein [Paenibacillus thiaminolyticus]WCF08158.1 hypothetical protein NDS46_28535 [Paenibacillus thiaminolyticus]WII37442.1 hypothetical protein O0V01_28335 [Paenibacillus thiaminolyticus]